MRRKTKLIVKRDVDPNLKFIRLDGKIRQSEVYLKRTEGSQKVILVRRRRNNDRLRVRRRWASMHFSWGVICTQRLKPKQKSCLGRYQRGKKKKSLIHEMNMLLSQIKVRKVARMYMNIYYRNSQFLTCKKYKRNISTRKLTSKLLLRQKGFRTRMMLRVELTNSNAHLQNKSLLKLTSWSRISATTFVKSVGLMRIASLFSLKKKIFNHLFSEEETRSKTTMNGVEDKELNLICSKLQQSREEKHNMEKKLGLVLMEKITLEEELNQHQSNEAKLKEEHAICLKEIMELQSENNELKKKFKELKKNGVIQDSSEDKKINDSLKKELSNKKKLLQDSKHRVFSLSAKCDKLRADIRKAKRSEKGLQFKAKKLEGKCGKRAYISNKFDFGM